VGTVWKGVLLLVMLGAVFGLVFGPRLVGSSSSGPAKLPGADPSGAEVRAPAQYQPSSPPTAGPAVDLMAEIKRVEALVQENPNDVEALTQQGTLYFRAGHYPRAADAFASALELAPNNARLHTDIGSAFLHQDMVGLARRHYLRAIELDPTLPEPHFNLGIILGYKSPPDVRGAVAEWQTVLRLDPAGELAKKAEQHIRQAGGGQ